MSGFLDSFRKKIRPSLWKEHNEHSRPVNVDDKIALGVLLWIVAEADGDFLPQEKKEIERILRTYSNIPAHEIPLVMAAIEQAARERIDLYRFTHEISKDLPYAVRCSIVEMLFRVAYADKVLKESELFVLRQIASLLHLSHRNFIAIKLKIKKEFGIDGPEL